MRAPKERFDFVHEFLSRVFGDALHAKRILSLTNGTLGVMTGAVLAVSLIGQALATARGLIAKSAIKQVDRLLSNAGVFPWDLFGSWIPEVVGARRDIVVAMGHGREPSECAFCAVPAPLASAAGETASSARALAMFSARPPLARSP